MEPDNHIHSLPGTVEWVEELKRSYTENHDAWIESIKEYLDAI